MSCHILTKAIFANSLKLVDWWGENNKCTIKNQKTH